MRPFLVLLWKNLIVTKRKPIGFAYQLLFPFIYIILLFLIKDKLKSTVSQLNEKNMMKFTVEKFPEITSSLPRCLFYTPNSELAGSLMDEVGRQLGLPSLSSIPSPDDVAFERCFGYYPFTNYNEVADLVREFHANEAIIEFQDMDAETWSSRRHDSLTYTIRIKKNFSTHVITSHEDFIPQDHTDYGDIYEDFTRIQWAIDTSYIKIQSGITVPQKLSLQEFPYFRQSTQDAIMAFVIAALLYTIFWAALIITFIHIVTRMMIDRATGIQELIKLNGVSGFTLGASYFISSLPPPLLFILVTSILVKVGNPSIIEHTGGVIILIGLIFYVVSVVSCGMACSYLAHTSQYSTTLAVFVYIATVLFARVLDELTSKAMLMVKGLVLHIPLKWMLNEIAFYEASGKPLKFGDIGKSLSSAEVSVLLSYFFMILQSLIFLILAWYLSHVRQGQYGNSQPWNFCFKKEYWTAKEIHDHVYTKPKEDSGRDEKYFETPPRNKEVGIRIINVSKFYRKQKALNDVTLDVYKGEITILLGHNGAGKTTLMSIITGMITATKGVVYVNGVNSRLHGHKVRKKIGLCPQHNLFLQNINVLEHVMFFHMLKKKSTIKKARIRSIALLEQLGIGDKLYYSPENLSGGMQRRLQLACALAGGADVLVLDEPTSGLDVETRRELWNLLLSLRGGHTVLLSTHFMEEADALGDRIAALHTGHLRSHATPMFLKKAMGSGYRLYITTTGVPNEAEITRVVKHHVSDATVKEKTSKTITYNLPSSATSKFPALFGALEKDTQKRRCCILPPKGKRGALGIATIGLGVTTLEEAFLLLCSDTEVVNEDEMDCTDKAAERNLVSGAPLYKRQVVALLRRHVNFVKAGWILFLLFNILIPLLLLYWLCKVTNNDSNEDTLSTEPDLVVDLRMYHLLPERRVLLNVNPTHKVSRRLMDKYGDVRFTDSDNITDDIIAIGKHNIVNYNKYVIGVELDDQHAKALYTTVHRHAAPAAVNLLSNVIASHWLPPPEGGDRLITVHNHPLGGVAQLAQAPTPPNQVKTELLCCFWAIAVSTLILVTTCNYVMLPAREGASGVRHLHVMAGCPAALHWLTTLAVHTALVTVTMVPAVVIFAYFVDTDDTLGQPVLIFFMVIIIILGITAFLGVLYVLSLSFSEKTAGVLGGVIAMAFGCFVPLIQLGADVFKEKLNFFEKAVIWITNLLMPPQTMAVAVSKVIHIGRLNALCKVNKDNCPNILVPDTPDFNAEKCCAGKTWPYFGFGQTAPGKEILIMIAQGIIYTIIVVKIQQGYFSCLYDRFRNRKFKVDEASSQDQLVADEAQYVASEIILTKSMIEEDDESILVSDIHKNFPGLCRRKHVYAVKGISFSVKRGECFGLLGTNGAGKSTTFKMLTASLCPTKGIIFANKYFLHEDKYKYLRTIGYCPQFLGIDEFQTGNDNLRTLLTIRGLEDQDINKEIKTWIDVVGLKNYKNTVASAYSGGYQRRLAAAVALCSGAPLSLLDEPTAGVDVGARRRVHAAFRKSLCQKRSIVITSHSMDEMETLCERIAIMVAGKIRALGTPAELRYQFAQGYTVIFKITSYLTESERSNDDRVEHLKRTMQKRFDCELKDEHMTMLHYHIDDKISYSQLFQQLELIRNSYLKLIEDYSVSETTLEEVFLLLAKEEREEDQEMEENELRAECGKSTCIGNKIGAHDLGYRNCDPCDLDM